MPIISVSIPNKTQSFIKMVFGGNLAEVNKFVQISQGIVSHSNDK